jgi:RNA polymerase sigma-70 factor (ECF subfamily)
MSQPGQGILDEPVPIAGDQTDELEEAVREHSRSLYRIAYSVLRNHHDAEDAAQETFIRFLRHRKDWPRIRDRRAWLARTVWRVAIDWKRRPPEISIDDAALAVWELRDAGAGPEEIAATRQMTALLEHLVDALPRELRDALALSTVDELSSPEIAAVLGIPEGSVRERLWRARQTLREKLAALVDRQRGSGAKRAP